MATVLGSAGWWIWAGASGPIDRQRLDALPPYLQNAMTSDAGVRVLAIDLQHARPSVAEAHYAVVAGDQLRLGDADRGFAFGGSTTAPQQIGDLVQRIVAGTADSDISPQLRSLGIGYVWVSGATTEEIARIDNTPALGTASGSEADHGVAAAAGGDPGRRRRGGPEHRRRRAAGHGPARAGPGVSSGWVRRSTRAGGPASTAPL